MHSMSGAGAADHGGGQLYGDNNPAAGHFAPLGVHADDDDDAGSAFFDSQASGANGFMPSYSSITDYLQGFLDPSALARHLDAPPCVPAATAGDAMIISGATTAASPSVATPNSSTSSEPRHSKKGRAAPEEEGDEQGEIDEEGSADHQNSGGDKKKKKKKGKTETKVRGSRVAFATKSEEDHLDDGYRWRKYGQKAVKNSSFPRSYYRCTAARCGVKKQVERSQQDPSTVVTTYEGQHAHPSPAAHRGTAAGLYSLASLQQQRHDFCPSSPDDVLFAAARAMAPPAPAASQTAALLPRQHDYRFTGYYGMQLQDVLLDPQHGQR